jgi:hypothetical protein
MVRWFEGGVNQGLLPMGSRFQNTFSRGFKNTASVRACEFYNEIPNVNIIAGD